MKSIPTRALTAILGTLLCWLLPSKGWASVQVDGLYFDLNTSAYTAAVAPNPSYYSGAVVIPASIVYNGNTYQVTSIGSCAFLDCNGMTSINMSSSVTTIESSAFERCTGLTSLYVGSGVTTINYEAFKNCSNLTTLTLPSSVRTISDEVFAGCSSLSVINAERSTAPTISSSTFNGVNKSTCIVFVPEGSASSYANATNWKTFSNIVENVVVATGYCGNNVTYTIYSDMTMVISGTGAMYNRSQNNRIDADYYGQIKRVVIGEGITRIGESAFYNWYNLLSVSIGNNVTSIGYGAFQSCYRLSSITIPSSVTIIEDYAFSLCTSVTSITIPNSVTSIGYNAFCGCRGVTSLVIPNSVTSIDPMAFGDCSSLTSIIVDSGNSRYDSRGNCNAIIETSTNTLICGCQNTVIPSSVTSIGEGAFYNCSSLTSISIPSRVTFIGRLAFYFCTGLKSVTIPNKVDYIGGGAFGGCTNLVSMNVSSNNYTFDSRDNCNAIIETSSNKLVAGCKNTVIPNSVTAIGSGAFMNCYELTSVTIPNGVTTIGSQAFWDCDDLTTVTFPNSVTSIGTYAFFGSYGLTSVEIPNSVTSIGDYAFGECYSLSTIWMENATPVSISSYVFSGVDKTTCTLYVPTGSKTSYENAAYWRDFQNIVEYSLDTDISSLDNAIYVEQTEGRIGGTMDIPVKLKNSYPVRGFQFRLELPEGTTINDWKLSTSRLPSGATLSDKIATQRIDGNTISVACSLNYGDATFTGNDGEIATVNVTFRDDMEVGSYPIYLTACDVTTAGGTDEDLSDVKSTLVLEDYLPGDANGDGKIRIGDATAILNYIVGNVPNNFQEKAADTNGDGKIRIGDATAILNIIVNQ